MMTISKRLTLVSISLVIAVLTGSNTAFAAQKYLKCGLDVVIGGHTQKSGLIFAFNETDQVLHWSQVLIGEAGSGQCTDTHIDAQKIRGLCGSLGSVEIDRGLGRIVVTTRSDGGGERKEDTCKESNEPPGPF